MPSRSSLRPVGSALTSFGRMVISPAAGVARVLAAGPSLRLLAWLLAVIGLLRGCIEGVWYYLMTGSIAHLPSLLAQSEWYYRWGGPFVLVNIPSTWFLWFTMGLLLHLTARLLGGQGHFRQLLQVMGVALFAYGAIGLLNYLHLFWALPAITLRASPFYQPNLGLGQLLVFAWLIGVSYQAVRQIYRLPWCSALLAAPLPILCSILLYLTSAALFFRLVPYLPGGDRPTHWLEIGNLAYLTATISLTALMALVSRKWYQGR